MITEKETRTFGENLKYLRNSNHFTQEMIAQKLGISRQSISNWENDKSFPDLPNLILLSKLYNITLDNLIKGETDEMKNMYKMVTMQTNFSKFYMLGAFVLCAILIGSMLNIHYLPTLISGIADIMFIIGLVLLSRLGKENIQLPKAINWGLVFIYVAAIILACSDFIQGFLHGLMQ